MHVSRSTCLGMACCPGCDHAAIAHLMAQGCEQGEALTSAVCTVSTLGLSSHDHMNDAHWAQAVVQRLPVEGQRQQIGGPAQRRDVADARVAQVQRCQAGAGTLAALWIQRRQKRI